MTLRQARRGADLEHAARVAMGGSVADMTAAGKRSFLLRHIARRRRRRRAAFALACLASGIAGGVAAVIYDLLTGVLP